MRTCLVPWISKISLKSVKCQTPCYDALPLLRTLFVWLTLLIFCENYDHLTLSFVILQSCDTRQRSKYIFSRQISHMQNELWQSNSLHNPSCSSYSTPVCTILFWEQIVYDLCFLFISNMYFACVIVLDMTLIQGLIICLLKLTDFFYFGKSITCFRK